MAFLVYFETVSLLSCPYYVRRFKDELKIALKQAKSMKTYTFCNVVLCILYKYL